MCTDRDRDEIEQHVVRRLPKGRVKVELLKCQDAPVYLPFHLLRLVQRAAHRAASSPSQEWMDASVNRKWLDDRRLEYVTGPRRGCFDVTSQLWSRLSQITRVSENTHPPFERP